MQAHKSSPRPQYSSEARFAYIVSGFPAVTETFVLSELIEMERLGIGVELYPLRRLRERVTHPEAQPWIERAHWSRFVSFQVLRAQWRFLRLNRKRYFSALAEVLEGTWGSLNFFLGAIAIFPKAVELAGEMADCHISHVHAQFANHPAVAALIIHRLTGIPFSFTARGTDIQVDRHMLRAKLEAAEFAIAVSHLNKEIMVQECGSYVGEKIHVVYGGIDLDRFLPSAKQVGRRFRILCVARFEEVKGHKYLVSACQLLRERGVPFECRLIGDGPLFAAIQKQIRDAGLCVKIQLLGARTNREVIDEMSWADVLVLPTAPVVSGQCEGIPNVLKEAMACGLPVVASSAGGIPELIENHRTGFLLPARNVRALADALQLLSDDPQLRSRLGRAGRSRVMERFDLKASTAKRAQLFIENLSSNGSRREGQPSVNLDKTACAGQQEGSKCAGSLVS